MAKTTKTDTLAIQDAANLEKQLIHMRDIFRQHQNEIRKRYKISATEMEIILYVNDFGPQRMKSVGEAFKIKFSTLTSLVDKIERLNLVKRVNSKEDRRSILVTITKKGKKMLDEYNAQIRELAEKLSEVALQDVPVLVDALEKVKA
ncbi:MAG: MarR family transcriptional regulator [Bacteroidia bacterium]|nr:MarR family transcriptional regulator [Bacteroidia bacterium]